jgi:hypothetical protein
LVVAVLGFFLLFDDFFEEDFFAGFAVLAASAGAAAAAGASADVCAATFDPSAAIAPAASPRANKAELIRIPDLFIKVSNSGIELAQRLRAGSRIRWINRIEPR